MHWGGRGSGRQPSTNSNTQVLSIKGEPLFNRLYYNLLSDLLLHLLLGAPIVSPHATGGLRKLVWGHVQRVYTCAHLSIYIYIEIYIHIQREREKNRERERERDWFFVYTEQRYLNIHTISAVFGPKLRLWLGPGKSQNRTKKTKHFSAPWGVPSGPPQS